MTTIRTPRLRLDTLTRDEAGAARDSDRSGRVWAEDYPSEGDVFIASLVGEAGEHYDETAVFGVMQVRRLDTGEAIGGIGFISAPVDGTAEVGYGLAGSAQGQGFAAEALAGILTWATAQGLSAVVAMTALDNQASHRVLERCDFVRGEVVDVGGDDGPMIGWERTLTT